MKLGPRKRSERVTFRVFPHFFVTIENFSGDVGCGIPVDARSVRINAVFPRVPVLRLETPSSVKYIGTEKGWGFGTRPQNEQPLFCPSYPSSTLLFLFRILVLRSRYWDQSPCVSVTASCPPLPTHPYSTHFLLSYFCTSLQPPGQNRAIEQKMQYPEAFPFTSRKLWNTLHSTFYTT